MAGQNVVIVTDATFEQEVLKSPVPTLVDFYADWCAPCRMMAPVVDELADEFVGKVKVCKIDTDAHRDAPSRYGISAIPTLILFNGGQVAERFVGVKSKADFRKALDALTKK
jgi:thioredoxin 1